VVDPVSPVVPIVMLVVRPRAKQQVVGVDAEPVMAPVSDHLVCRRWGPRDYTADEPISR